MPTGNALEAKTRPLKSSESWFLGVVTEEGVQTMTPAPYFSVFAVDEISI
jgi:hypothetical protein